MQVNIPNRLLMVVGCVLAAPVLFAAGQASQSIRTSQPVTRQEMVDALARQERPKVPLVIPQHEPPVVSAPRLSATLIAEVEEPVTALVEPRAATVNDVVAVWVKGSEWNREVSVSAWQDSGLAAKPVLVVGVITNLSPTHVTLASRKWFSSRPEQADRFYVIELIPRDIIYRVQVLGTAGDEFTDDVSVASGPTTGFSDAPAPSRSR